MKKFKLLAAGSTEIAEQVDRIAMDHLAYLQEVLVWRQIRVDDLSFDRPCSRKDGGRRHETHPAQLRVQADQRWNICLTMLQGMDIASRRFLDKLPIQL